MKNKKIIVLLCFLISIVAFDIVIINLAGETKVETLPTTKQHLQSS